MNLLGIDYGQAVIGISLATTPLAEPWLILDNDTKLIPKIVSLCQQYSVGTIVVGLSEGQMADLTKQFAATLAKATSVPIVFHDETLTSVEAQARLRHAPKHVRSDPQDAFQATVMLQDYIDRPQGK